MKKLPSHKVQAVRCGSNTLDAPVVRCIEKEVQNAQVITTMMLILFCPIIHEIGFVQLILIGIN